MLSLRRVRSNVLPVFLARNGFAKQAIFHGPTHNAKKAPVQLREFSNQSFQDALKKIKESRASAVAEANGEKIEKPVNDATATEVLPDKPVDHTAAAESNTDQPINYAAASESTTDKPINEEEIKETNTATDEKISEEKTEEPAASPAAKIDFADLRYRAFAFARDAKTTIKDNVIQGWHDMIGTNQTSLLEKKFEQSQSFRRKKTDNDDDEEVEEPEYTGPSSIVVVKQAKSYWEQMAARLDAPIIREMLKGAKIYGQAAADTSVGKQAQKVSQNVRDKIEDAREFWETSQNPIVHTLSGVWENLTGDTEEGLIIAEIRKRDPDFIKENWTEEVRRTLAPLVIKGHLEGDTRSLKPWLTEGVFSRLSAEIRARKKDGIVIDSNILDIDENTVMLRFLETGEAAILVIYMVQQINCIRNTAGEVIEGAESEVRAKFYNIVFQQVYEEIDGDENNAVLKWKVVDYQLAGDVPYY